MFYYMHNNYNYQCKICWNKPLTFGVGWIMHSFHTIVFTQIHTKMFSIQMLLHFSQIVPRVCTLVLFIILGSTCAWWQKTMNRQTHLHTHAHARTHTHTHTHTRTHAHTHTLTRAWDNYSNPRCACAPRVNEGARTVECISRACALSFTILQ